MKLILFVLITTLMSITCPSPKPCENEKGQLVFQYWKIELKPKYQTTPISSLGDLKSEEADGIIQSFYTFNRIDLKHFNNVIVKLLYNSFYLQCYEHNDCILEFSLLGSDVDVHIHLSFSNPKCVTSLQFAMEGIPDNYRIDASLSTPIQSFERAEGYSRAENLVSFDTPSSFSITNVLSDISKSVALDISFFPDQGSKVMVEYIINTDDDGFKKLFYFDFRECGQECIKSLRNYVFGSAIEFQFSEMIIGDHFNEKGFYRGSLNFDLESKIVIDDKGNKIKANFMIVEKNNVHIKGYYTTIKSLPVVKIPVNMNNPVEIVYKYINKKFPDSLNAALIYAKNKINKQKTVSCPNSTFTYWEKLILKQEILDYEGFLGKRIANSQFFKTTNNNLEEGTIEFKDGEIKINGKEFFYYYSTTFTNAKIDQAMVNVYFSKKETGGITGENILKDIQVLQFYFSLAAGCKEELIKTLRNKSTCFPDLVNGFRLFNSLEKVNAEEEVKIDQALIYKHMYKLGIVYENNENNIEIIAPHITFENKKLLIEGTSTISKYVTHKRVIEYNTIPKGHPCEKELLEINPILDTRASRENKKKEENKANTQPQEIPKPNAQSQEIPKPNAQPQEIPKPNAQSQEIPKPNAQPQEIPKPKPKSEPIQQADSCRDKNNSNKIIFPYERTSLSQGKQRGIIISKYYGNKVLNEENGKQKFLLYVPHEKSFLSCEDLTCTITFKKPAYVFTFKFDLPDCPKLLKEAFNGQPLLTTSDYANYYFRETNNEPETIKAYTDKFKKESILSQSNFSIEKVSSKLEVYNTLDFSFFQKEQFVMVQYVIKKADKWEIIEFWFDFTGHQNHQEVIKGLEKQIFESTFKYTQRDGTLQEGEIIFNMKTENVSIRKKNDSEPEVLSVQLINFDTDYLYISGYNRMEPFQIVFGIGRGKNDNSLTNQLKYVKAKMSTVEKIKKDTLNYWGLTTNIHLDPSSFRPLEYKSHKASLQMGTIQFEKGKIKIKKLQDEKEDDGFFYYFCNIHQSEENSNIISISVFYSIKENNIDKIKMINTNFYFTLTEENIKKLIEVLKQQMTCQLTKNLFYGKDRTQITFNNGLKQIECYSGASRSEIIFNATLTIDPEDRNKVQIKEKLDNGEFREIKFEPNNLPPGHPCEIKFRSFIEGNQPKLTQDGSFIEFKTLTGVEQKLLFPSEYGTLPLESGYARYQGENNTKSELLKTKSELADSLLTEIEYMPQTNLAIDQDSEAAFYSKVPVRASRLKANQRTLKPSDKQTE
jgi:hypothetical protein